MIEEDINYTIELTAEFFGIILTGKQAAEVLKKNHSTIESIRCFLENKFKVKLNNTPTRNQIIVLHKKAKEAEWVTINKFNIVQNTAIETKG